MRDIPFDELKIDRGFAHGAWSNETVRAIFATSAILAKQLDKSIVTEGVEDRADWDFVRRLGCNIAQGYFIAKPMPAEELQARMVDWNRRIPKVMERLPDNRRYLKGPSYLPWLRHAPADP